MRFRTRSLFAGVALVAAGFYYLTSTQPAAISAQAEPLFPCVAPWIHDGDNIRCEGMKSARLYAIDAPEMPGACRPGRRCTPGDPYASRDHLRTLVAGRAVECRQRDTDHYGRPVLQCFADHADLSCSQVRDGYAVERYGTLECSTGLTLP